MPFITFPYLVRVLGIEKFGLLSFSMATVMYFSIIIDYGFNLTASRDISIYKDNHDKIQEIFSNVMCTKFILILISLIILTIIIFSINKISNYWYIFYLSFGVVMGQHLLPLWFFQGIEEMKYITIFNLIAKIFFTLMLFLLIKSKNDFYLVPVLNAVGYIIVGLYSLIYIIKKFSMKINCIGLNAIKNNLFKNFSVFISNVGITFYSISTTFLLGLFTNNIIVGYFSMVEKLILAIRQLYAPFTQTIYPYFMKKFYENRKKTFYILNIFAVIGSLIMLIISFFIFLWGKEILIFIFGEDNFSITSLYFLKVLVFVPIFTFLGSLYLMNAMIALHLHSLRNKIIFLVGINYIIGMILILKTNYLLFPYLYLTAEFFIFILSFIYVYKFIKR